MSIWALGFPNRPGLSTHHKPRGKEGSGSKSGKKSISARSAPGREQTSVLKPVSKVLNVLLGLDKENVGQRLVEMGRCLVKLR